MRIHVIGSWNSQYITQINKQVRAAPLTLKFEIPSLFCDPQESSFVPPPI